LFRIPMTPNHEATESSTDSPDNDFFGFWP
jgi:hypothetical protein